MIKTRYIIFITLLTLLLYPNLTFSAPVDDIRPLKGPVDIEEKALIWPIILLILLSIVGSAVFSYFKKKKHIDEIAAVPPRPPEEIAMEKLKSLLEERLAEKGMMKEYYIKLSDIIREFIEGRYKIIALDKTTWELYQEMRSKNVSRLHVDKIKDFLEDCDLVKFAKYIPTQKEAVDVYNKAKEIVGLV